MWGYLAAFPGLVVLHDARLHQARARDAAAAGAVRRLPARVLVRPSRRAARLRRVRGGRPRRADLLLLVDAARRDAHGAARRGPQPARRRRSARRVSRRAGRSDPPRASAPAARRTPRRARARARQPRRAGRRGAVRRVRQDHRRETDRRDPARVRRGRAASAATSTCCWPATRRTIRRSSTSDRHPRIARAGPRRAATCRRRRSATTSRRPTPACACAGRPRWKRRRRGCSAWRRRGRRSSAISRTWSTSRRSIRAAAARRTRRAEPVAIAIDLLDEDESLRLRDARARRRSAAAARRWRAPGHAYWSRAPHARRDGRRLPAPDRAAPPRAPRRWSPICRRISPTTTPGPPARSLGRFGIVLTMFWSCRLADLSSSDVLNSSSSSYSTFPGVAGFSRQPRVFDRHADREVIQALERGGRRCPSTSCTGSS